MITRRIFCGCIAGGLSAVATAVHAQSLECSAFTSERQASTTPDDAIARLKAGNERFAAGKSTNCDLMAQVKQTATSQSPYAAIVGASILVSRPNWFSISTLVMFSVRALPAISSTRILSAASNIQPRLWAPRPLLYSDTAPAGRSKAQSMASSWAILPRCSGISGPRSPP